MRDWLITKRIPSKSLYKNIVTSLGVLEKKVEKLTLEEGWKPILASHSIFGYMKHCVIDNRKQTTSLK